MPLEPLCRNTIFKDVPNYDDIKEDPHMSDTIDFPINFGNTKGEA